MSTLGKLIRDKREAMGMSQMALAKELGYNYSQNVSYYESGKRAVPKDKLHQVCETLDLEVVAVVDAYLEDVRASLSLTR